MPADPLSPACEACGLYRTHSGTTIHRAEIDTRNHPPGTKPVLFILPYPSPIGAHSGALTNDRGVEWILDYLNADSFTAEWTLTSALLCSPPFDDAGKIEKVGPKMYSYCASHYLSDLIAKLQPVVIVALGGEGLEAVWPKSRGKCPSITKARLAPVRIEELPGSPWLLASYNPRTHGWWVDSGGTKGQDLTEEYIRLFTLIVQCVEGKYTYSAPEWKLIQTTDELRQLVEYFQVQGVRDLVIDVEDDSYLARQGEKIRPNADDHDGVMPQCLTVYHEDNRLLCVGVTVRIGTRYETYVISADPYYTDADEGAEFVRWMTLMCDRRTLSVWNAIYETQAFYVFLGVEVEKIAYFWDGWLKRGLRDQSLFNNGLKETAMTLLTVPDWQKDLDTWKTAIRKELLAKKLPGWVKMGDVPREVIYLYNAWDTYTTARIKYEFLEDENYDYPQRAYEALIDGLPWLAEMERNGIPVNEELLWQTLDELEAEEAGLEVQIRKWPAVLRAESASGKPFNLRSSIFYNALILDMYGEREGGTVKIPDNFPKTETGKPASDADTIGRLAGEELAHPVAWEDKTSTQRFWFSVMKWREAGDDFNRLLGLSDYVIDGRIHPRYRGLRTETIDDGDETKGGAKSGRWSSSPNAQNLKNTERFQRPFEAPPGWVWYRFDYGRIELAWLAWNTQDPLMCQWAIEGKDAHQERGAALWAVTFQTEPAEFAGQPAAVQKEWRAIGKTQNFATVYLEEPRTTSGKTGIPYERVLADLRTADEVHPSIRRLKMEIYEKCQADHYVESTLLGRRRTAVGWIPSTQTAEQFTSLDEEHMRKRNQHNLAIFRSIWNTAAAQADASDTTFCMGKHIHNRINCESLYGSQCCTPLLDPTMVKSVGFIHDSLDFLIWHEYEAEAAPIIAAGMGKLHLLPKHPKQFGLPIPVDMKRGYNLADFVKEK